VRHVLALAVLVGAILFPSTSLAQHPAWFTQLEGQLGWRFQFNEVTQVVIDGGPAAGVELQPGLAYGARVLFPVASAPSRHLGKIFIGLGGSVTFGSDMRLADTDVVVGQADCYEVGVVLGIGKFVTASPGNLTVHGALGVGLAHTAFNPSDGVTLVEQEKSGTSLLANATLGMDISVGRALSVVTSAGFSLGFRDPLDLSLVLLGGLALRLPTSGGPGH